MGSVLSNSVSRPNSKCAFWQKEDQSDLDNFQVEFITGGEKWVVLITIGKWSLPCWSLSMLQEKSKNKDGSVILRSIAEREPAAWLTRWHSQPGCVWRVRWPYAWSNKVQRVPKRVSGNMFTFQQDSAPAHRAWHGTRFSYCIAVLQTSLFQTYGHLTHQTSTRLTMPSGQSCSSVCIRPESMTLTSCDSIFSPCGVDWNSTLWMTPLISGNVVC